MLTIDETGGLAAMKDYLVRLRRQIEDRRQEAVANIQRRRASLEDYERAEWDRYYLSVQPLETELEFLQRALCQVEVHLR